MTTLTVATRHCSGYETAGHRVIKTLAFKSPARPGVESRFWLSPLWLWNRQKDSTGRLSLPLQGRGAGTLPHAFLQG